MGKRLIDHVTATHKKSHLTAAFTIPKPFTQPTTPPTDLVPD